MYAMALSAADIYVRIIFISCVHYSDYKALTQVPGEVLAHPLWRVGSGWMTGVSIGGRGAVTGHMTLTSSAYTGQSDSRLAVFLTIGDFK